IDHHLVKHVVCFSNDIVFNIFRYFIDIIKLIPKKKVNGADFPVPNIVHDLFYFVHSKKNHQICCMRQLNLPSYSFRFKSSENKIHIFDVVRKKFVVIQPEEWVRQHIVHQLIYDKKYPLSLINVEKQLRLNKLTKRYDIVV